MEHDPIVEELHRVRKAHSEKFAHDLDAICADLKRKEATCGHPVVSLPPKPALKATG